MSPDLLAAIRVELVVHMERYSMAGDDAQADRVAEIIAALPPDSGGAMPEPWPGMVVQIFSGARHAIESAHPGNGRWYIVPTGLDWDADNVREIRTPDGRVLWRAEAVTETLPNKD
jgi:hypothetical protein